MRQDVAARATLARRGDEALRGGLEAKMSVSGIHLLASSLELPELGPIDHDSKSSSQCPRVSVARAPASLHPLLSDSAHGAEDRHGGNQAPKA